MKKLAKRIKKEDKKIKEILKYVGQKHNYSWEKEGVDVSLIITYQDLIQQRQFNPFEGAYQKAQVSPAQKNT